MRSLDLSAAVPDIVLRDPLSPYLDRAPNNEILINHQPTALR